MTQRRQIKRAARGIVLLALLLTLALVAVALLGALAVWSTEKQREAEADLLYVGDQYRLGIERYYYATPGATKVLPTSIDDLVEDPRFAVPMRHLRRAWPDPVTGKPFELLRAGEQIIGVVSSSTKSTIKRTGFSQADREFDGLETHDQWKFLFHPSVSGKSGHKLPPQSPRQPVAIGGTP